uniref:Heparan sulphate-N-deacetylase domain-containing protein n=1 Tax=Ditylenchus dipsaci TaxID=166011 RepID=A0A915E648_9BILA
MRHRHYFYHQLAKFILIFFCLYFIYLYLIFSANKEVYKIRHKAHQLPLYQCPSSRTILLHKSSSTKAPKPAPINVNRRILLITQLNPNHPHKLISSFLGYLKVPIRVEIISEDLPLFELAFTGRFSLIVFEDYQLYHELSNLSKSLLHEYCNKHNIGLISFLSLKNEDEDKDFGVFTAKGGQKAHNLAFSEHSLIGMVGKVSSKLPYAEPYLHNGHSEDVYGTPLHAAIHLLDTQHVVFGHGLQHWMIEIAFLDAILYMAPNIVDEDLKGENFDYKRRNSRKSYLYILQIDIDDVFVGQTGTRFIPNDVSNLKETQQDLRKYIHNFSFTLGFSGYFFRHGDSLEVEGDERLVEESNLFLWFPHMWRHNHAHEYTDEYLMALMTQNRVFADNMKLNSLPGYAISPQHSGVYPIYTSLYKSWGRVWNVQVTSTEEYPHLRPASARRGFIYANVSVLPDKPVVCSHILLFSTPILRALTVSQGQVKLSLKVKVKLKVKAKLKVKTNLTLSLTLTLSLP